MKTAFFRLQHLAAPRSASAQRAARRCLAGLGAALTVLLPPAVPAGTLSFDGADDYLLQYIDLPETAATFEFWIRTTKPDAGIFEARGGDGGYDRNLYLLGGNLYARLWNLETIGTTGLNLADGQWHHIAHVFGASIGGQRLYVDGVQRAAGTKTNSDYANQNHCVIGFSRTPTGYFLAGEIDEVRFWNVVRSQAQLIQYQHRPLTGNEANLLAYLPFEEGFGTTTTDASGHGKSATLLNGPVWNLASDALSLPIATPLPASGVAETAAHLNAMVGTNGVRATNIFQWGLGSTALAFDGFNDLACVTNDAALNAFPLTATAWVKVAPGTAGGIIDKYWGGSWNGWQIWVSSGRLHALYIRNTANYAFDGDWDLDAGSIDDNQWHHVAFTVGTGADGVRVYVDGTARVIAGWTGTAGAATTTYGLKFGVEDRTPFRGQIDEVTIWNTNLNAAGISDLMGAPPDVEDPALLGYWNFEEGAGAQVTDRSGHGRHAILGGDPTWIAGARPVFTAQTAAEAVIGPNNVLDLDGMNDYVAVPPGTWFLGDLTIEGWVYPRDYRNWSRLIDFGNGAPSDNVLLAITSGTSGQMYFQVFRGGAGQGIAAPIQLPLRQWSHVAATLRSGWAQLYLNGVVVASGPVWSPLQPVSGTRVNNYIGRSNWAPDSYAHALFEDVRIWSAALPSDTIRNWMSRPVDTSHASYANLAGNWRFDETSGDGVLDASPHLRHAGLVNGARRLPQTTLSEPLTGLLPGAGYHFRSLTRNTNGTTTSPTGAFRTAGHGSGGALHLDGVNDYVRIGGISNSLPTGEVTIEFWQRVMSLQDQSTFSLEPDPGPGDSRMQAHVPWSDGVVYWDFGNVAAGGRLTYVPPVSLVGGWHHFALVSSKQGNFMRIYHNGRVVNGKNGASALTPANYSLILGAVQVPQSGYNYTFHGDLDEFRLWTVARTEAEIGQHYNVRLTGIEAGLTAYYRMDEGSGNVLWDATVRGNQGLLVNEPERIDSGATVGTPVPTANPATDVGFGRAVLRGSVAGNDDLPTRAWFEYGTAEAPVPGTGENRADYYNLGYNLTTVNAVNWSAVPDWMATFTNINLAVGAGAFWPAGPGDYFAARYTGRVFVPDPGLYTFYLNSDDGSQLFLDGRLLVNNDGPHGPREYSASRVLEAGYHTLEARMFEQGGGATLIVSYSGPGILRQVIPLETFQGRRLYQNATAAVEYPAATGSREIEAPLDDLLAGTSYFYRVVAANNRGTNYSEPRTFMMPHPAAQSALQLDGVDDYVKHQPFNAFPSTNITVEFWMRASDPTRAGTPLSYAAVKSGAAHDNEFLVFDYRSFDIYVGTAQVDTGISANDGQWHHIAVTWSSLDGSLVVYRDGTNTFSTNNFALGYSLASGGNFILGQDQDSVGGGFDATQAFAGEMDEVRVWNVIRTEQEINETLYRSLRGDETGLTLYYRFDEASGTQALDSSGHGRTGTEYNGPIYRPSTIPLFQPLVTTLPPTPVLATKATLRGTVNPGGATTFYYFEYGPTLAYGQTTPSATLTQAGITPQPVSAVLTNLMPGTTYHYRLVAQNRYGENYGVDQTFTTLVLSAGWPISTKLTGGQASAPRHVLDGLGNAYVAGLFSGSATFAQTLLPQTAPGVDNPAHTNAFIGKLARGADWIWATNIPVSGAARIHAIAVVPEQDVFVAGEFIGTATFGSTTLNAATNDLFVARLKASGNGWVWARQLGGTGPHSARALALDSQGNVCLAGSFSGSVTVGTNSLVALGGSDILVAKLNAAGNWLWAARAGGAAPGESVAALVVDSQDNLAVAGQFGATGVPATFAAGAFTRTLTPAGGADLFVAKLSRAGQWVMARRAGSTGDDLAAALEIDGADQTYLLGRFAGVADYDGVLENLNTDGRQNFFVAKLSSEASVLWYAQGGEGEPASLAVAGDVAYVTGHFSISTTFGTGNSLSLVSAGNSDVFMAQMDAASGAWNWAQAIGGTGAELSGSVAVEPSGSVVLSGSFQSTIQMGYVLLTSANERDIFVARLDAVPVYEHNTYVIGQPIPVPLDAQDPARGDGGAYGIPIIALYEKYHPDTDALNAFAWSPAEHRLYAVRPVTAVLKWPLSLDITNLTRVATCVARTVWPEQPQIHVAGTPVELEPAVAGFRYKFVNLAFADAPGTAVDASTRQFLAPQTGWSVLHFLDTGGAIPDPNVHSSVFEVVRTLAWDDASILDDAEPAIIGEELKRPGHNDPTRKRGYVFFERSFYDGVGEDQAHKRSTRTGPIIPVNEDTASPDDDLVVVWYRTNQVTGIAWPDDPVRYRAQWPAQPAELVLAGGDGSGELTAVDHPGKRVYRQSDPGLPGYNPNEEHAALYGDVLYALRNDLNEVIGVSKPYTLLKYRDPNSSEWAMRVYAVVATNADHQFVYSAEAGKGLELVPPLNFLGLCGHTNTWIAGPGFQDHEGRLYARAAGAGTGGTNIVTRYWYPLQPEFFYDLDLDGTPEAPEGASIPWLDRRSGGSKGTPVDITYQTHWPTDVKTLQIGETLFNAKYGLPAIRNFASARIIYDQANPGETDVLHSLARIFDPLSERTVTLSANFELPPEISTANVAGRLVFVDLPYVIRSRLFYDPLNQRLSFGGLLNEDIGYGGPDNPLLLVNVMTPRERDRIWSLSPNTPFRNAVGRLYNLTRNPNQLDLTGDGVADPDLLIGLNWGTVTNPVTRAVSTNLVHEQLGDLPKAMTAAIGTGSGFVTIVENDDERLPGLPVILRVIRVDDGPYLGDLKVLYPDNVFDERLTIRHSADFAGEPQRFEFEWFYKPYDAGVDRRELPEVDSEGNLLDMRGWIRFPGVTSGVNGVNDVTLGDANMSSLLTISDNLVVCRYRGYDIGNRTNVWSDWVGVINGGESQLAEGWVKRVVYGLNPFEARTKDFHASEAMTYASMIRQAGARYEGPIAFNPSADNLNQIGLIQAYSTVLERGKTLSVSASPPVNFGPANNALMLAAGRIADLYLLLGNEAYADAADPTIGFRTDSFKYGTLAPCIFTFQNQLDSLLEEELCLLRGRDSRSATVMAPPVYNRLFWNFTKDQGEVAYAQAYAISDQNLDGSITAEDARLLYPQGHGDAWGHYLTAVTTYYDLLRNPVFNWERRTEAMLLGGVPVEVDYLDERKFARAAAAKAKTGAEVVDLTYRLSYVDDPAGQYQGYKDTDPDRAWGLSEWGHRAGQGAYFDWLMANALLPAVDPNPTNTGLYKIDRTTVLEIAEIAAAFETVQLQVDKADAGLNPLGLAKNVVPFDIDPTLVSSGKTHFEQIYERALRSMENAVAVFNHANSLSQSLRALQDTIQNFSRNTQDRERDLKNRLIEVFGYPYAGDIGPGGTYPSGYDGPDLYHYMYVDTAELNGETAAPSQSFTAYFTPLGKATSEIGAFFPEDLSALQDPGLGTNLLTVNCPYSAADYGFIPPSTWGLRRAPGQVQIALSELLQREAALKRALRNYDNLIARIDDQLDLLEARHSLEAERIRVRKIRTGVNAGCDVVIAGAQIAQRVGASGAFTARRIADIAAEGFPKVVGLANDATSAGRASVLLAGEATAKGYEIAQAAGAIAEGAAVAAKGITEAVTGEQLIVAGLDYELQQRVKALEASIREEAPLRLEIFTLKEAVHQAAGEYLAKVAEGLRIIDERLAFRKATAGTTQSHRYQDMTFRVFRNDALQKYRAQFDLAARYVFLAAVAYDFETQLLGGSAGAGRDFLTDIIRQRSLGQFESGRPIAGRHGLADPLARLDQNFQVLKGQLGFNNPQTETGRFSLRHQLFRLRDSSDEAWRAELQRHLVADIWQVPEFRRYCRPFAPESAGAQPGLVLRFPTTVTFGLNYFGWPLGGGDSAYDPSLFATKVRSAGVWFANYDGSGLSFTPRVYLVPAGADILRSPSGRDLETREWRVVDQKIPVPFPIGYAAMSDPSWIPVNDSLSDVFADIRRFSSFRAYHDSGVFQPAEAVSDTRLIGRSVWNTDWMLIIPGGTFLYDPDRGLDTFINTVSDIKIFFQTYAYSGN